MPREAKPSPSLRKIHAPLWEGTERRKRAGGVPRPELPGQIRSEGSDAAQDTVFRAVSISLGGGGAEGNQERACSDARAHGRVLVRTFERSHPDRAHSLGNESPPLARRVGPIGVHGQVPQRIPSHPPVQNALVLVDTGWGSERSFSDLGSPNSIPTALNPSPVENRSDFRRHSSSVNGTVPSCVPSTSRWRLLLRVERGSAIRTACSQRPVQSTQQTAKESLQTSSTTNGYPPSPVEGLQTTRAKTNACLDRSACSRTEAYKTWEDRGTESPHSD